MKKNIVIGLALSFVLMLFIISCISSGTGGKEKVDYLAKYKQALADNKPILVDYTAPY